jgi:hypothetical protein
LEFRFFFFFFFLYSRALGATEAHTISGAWGCKTAGKDYYWIGVVRWILGLGGGGVGITTRRSRLGWSARRPLQCGGAPRWLSSAPLVARILRLAIWAEGQGLRSMFDLQEGHPLPQSSARQRPSPEPLACRMQRSLERRGIACCPRPIPSAHLQHSS